MRTVDDLRRAMDEATRDLAPRVTFAEVRQRASRRRFGRLFAVFAAVLLPLVAAMTVALTQPAAPPPTPTPTTTATLALPSGMAGSGRPEPGAPLILTGVAFGTEEEVVLWYSGSVYGGARDKRTGLTRPFDFSAELPGRGSFSLVLEVDDRHGGILDYGVVGGTAARVDVAWEGRTAPAVTQPIAGVDATLFWVWRTGPLVGPTGAVAAGQPKIVFTARNAAGRVLATTEEVQRSDGVLNIADQAKPVGDRMRTGLRLATGGELVLWFAGSADAAELRAGSDDGRGTTTELRSLGMYHRPPFAIDFYGGRQVFEEAGGTSIVLKTYVGPAATVTLVAPHSTTHGSAAWSAHPELRLAWIAGVPRGEEWRVTGVATNAAGTPVAVTGP